ncbi:MAG TPA: efflux RND transporter periplasmic adaptor subunit [Longimicrobium sp.]|nr:efflux RND transporter periplasmic adaptor subunit [Longimicrobium sp.]
MMDRKKIGARGAVLAAALVLAGCGKDGDAAVAKGPVEVVVGPEAVQVVAVEEIRTGPALSGNLKAEREAQVRAQAGGTVLSISADKGQAVRAGQTLARIDDLALRDQLTSTQSGVRSAQSALELARRNYERSQTLAAAGAIAERDLELARNQLSQAQAALADARARSSSAREQLGNTTVTAPISGVVSERPVSAGDVVQPGAALFTVVDPASMQLEASVPAAQLGQVRRGAPVRFTVSAYPGRVFTGTVQRINPAADAATGQVPVIVTIPNSEGSLVSGLFAEGRVEAEVRQGVMIPANAVDERGVQPTVLRLRAGKAERVPVQLGVRDPETDRVEVVSGVAAGDTLLVGGALGPTPGTPVTVRTGGAPAPAAAAPR